MKNIGDVVKNRLCLGCGLCLYVDSLGKMRYSRKKGQNIPEISMLADKSTGALFTVCPGKGYPIISWAKELYDHGTSYNIDLGYVHKAYAVHSNDAAVLRNASSGGIMTELCLFLLKQGIVDKVIVTKFDYTQEGIRTKTILTDSSSDILECQGSKYCPVDLSDTLRQLKVFTGTVAFVGTPCQIAGIRGLQKECPGFRAKKIITIGNFCGGFKDYNNIRQLARIHDVQFDKIGYFRFRGGGQPGSLVMSDTSGTTIQIPYPAYVGFTGYSRHFRCRFCVDATAELADFGCGDAWLPRFENDSSPWSIVISRSPLASTILEQMIKYKRITATDISLQEIIESQKINIKSKKYRQTSRIRFFKMLGYQLPIFDGGYRKEPTGLRTEIIVYIKYKLKLFLEKIGVYHRIYQHIKLKPR